MVVYGLLGYPLRYSLSPVIHQAAFAALGLQAAYFLWPTAPEDLFQQVKTMRQRQDLGGFNVTVPHKTSIMPLLDEIAPSAQAISAVNTVTKNGEWLVGHNTDLSGFRASLVEDGVLVAGQRALVLGAGGAARSVCHVLLQLGVERLYLANRTEAKAIQLIEELRVSAGRMHATPTGMDAGLIHANPTGMHATPTGVDREGERQRPRADATRDALGKDEMALRLGHVQVVEPRQFGQLAEEVTLVVNCTSSQDPWPALGLIADDFWSRGRGWAVDLAYGQMLAGFLAGASQHSWQTLSGEGMLLWQAAHAFQLWTGYQAPIDVMRQAMRKAL